MQESFLHYIWKTKSFNLLDLTTTEGQKLSILQSGLPNNDGGPDFFNAQIKLEETKWAGNAEIHLKSSDWYLHHHEQDAIYDKVILHIVWEDDQPVHRMNGERIPTLELKGKVKRHLLCAYNDLIKTQNRWVPCGEQIKSIDAIQIDAQLSKCMVERLETKSRRIEQMHLMNKGYWESTLYQLMAKYFGFKTNALPFELLTHSLDYKIIRQYAADLNSIEALCFGQAGFLNQNFEEDYPKQLYQRYQFLQQKHQLTPIDRHLWKFLRMRPVNFPTIRLSQFAALWFHHSSLFQKCMNSSHIDELRNLFKVEASGYWQNHYVLDKPSQRYHHKLLGNDSIDVLIINVILPLKFFYFSSLGKDVEEVLEVYTQIKPEKNQIIANWTKSGIKAKSSFDSQALIQLKNNHCDLKKCLICNIGNAILKPT